MAFTWFDVDRGDPADHNAVNALGRAVMAHDQALAAVGATFVYAKRVTVGFLAQNFAAETPIFTKTLTLRANRVYDVLVDTPAATGAAPPVGVAIAVKDAAGSFGDSGEYRLQTQGQAIRVPLCAPYLTGNTAPTVTFTVTARRVSGSSAFDVGCSTPNPFWFRIVDRGPASGVE